MRPRFYSISGLLPPQPLYGEDPLLQELAEIIDELPYRPRTILLQVIVNEMPLRAIGESFLITGQRVSQIFNQTLNDISQTLNIEPSYARQLIKLLGFEEEGPDPGEAEPSEPPVWVWPLLDLKPHQIADAIYSLSADEQEKLIGNIAKALSLRVPVPQKPRIPARGKRLRRAERQKILSLWRQGITNRSEIARIVNTTPQSVLRILREEGLVAPKHGTAQKVPRSHGSRGRRLTHEERELILDLWVEEGIRNLSEIARAVDTSPQTIARILAQKGLYQPGSASGWDFFG